MRLTGVAPEVNLSKYIFQKCLYDFDCFVVIKQLQKEPLKKPRSTDF